MRFTRTKWLMLLLMLPMWCMALVIKPDAPQIYQVKKGDTLWDISAMYLSQPWLWPELWRNNTHISNPHLIYPGDELRLVINEKGEAQLVLSRSSEDKPHKKLSPQGKMLDKSAEPVPVIPWSTIAPFIKDAVVMEEEQFNALPKVLKDYDDTVRFASEDLLVGDPGLTEDVVLVLRKQGAVFDLQGNQIGVQLRNLASGTVVPTQKQDFSLVKLHTSRMESRPGDRMAPASIMPQPEDIELQAADGQQGHILGNLQEHNLMGRLDVVVIDLGQGQVSPGTVMGIYKQGPKVRTSKPDSEDEGWLPAIFDEEDGPQPPAIKTGELVVFKTFSAASYALIINSSAVVRRGDIIAKP
ncbi:LysM domain-containing protein [Lacimicrobium sp. SS2-24]|uniref:LysM peptidoglycan-binding domain-containing protein n=1 Tax=Lacimicrobium sp. SS2-24 TaxID=2005569 RepID=UPI00113059EC|nr:LysM domain-containing protein [Lacimicrobium sp. SS2-24]